MTELKTYKTPNGSTILCDITNDFAFQLTDLAPLNNGDNCIKALQLKPSQLVGVLDNYELLNEGSLGITNNLLENIQGSADQTSAALATYLLQLGQ
jgi:hypothetical protein